MVQRLVLCLIPLISVACCCRDASETTPGRPREDCGRQWSSRVAGTSTYELLGEPHATGHTLVGRLKAVQSTAPELGPDLQELDLRVSCYSDITRVKIGAAGRWEVPQWLFAGGGPGGLEETACRQGAVQLTASPFSFTVRRPGDNAKLFESSASRLIFKDQYLELSSAIAPSTVFFGAGERTATGGQQLRRDGSRYALWNSDTLAAETDVNLYGSFPALLGLDPGGTASAVLLLSSNGMDISLTQDRLTFRVLGGLLDLFVLPGPTPEHVTEQLTRVVGRPQLPPYWSLGLHNCRWGYRNLEAQEAVVRGYRKANIPLEGVWSDIDHMDGYRDFTLDPKNYPRDGMRAFLEELHANGQRFVPIVDPGIKVDKGYKAYDRGLQQGVFIRDRDGQPYLGEVWPGQVHWPDFLHNATAAYWARELRDFHVELLAFDGIWIDMNEVSNFRTEDCEHSASVATKPDYDPPYHINNHNEDRPLGCRTLSVTARHVGGELEYNAHNLYGLAEARATHRAVARATGKRPFVLTRSTFLGSGAWAAHWTGDNRASWADLRYGVTTVLSAGLVGIPFIGPDICGFSGNTTEELCLRWASAGAFFPFSRVHSDINSLPQELYRWASVAAAARKAFGLRYELLPYLYTALHRARRRGTPAARPLWYAFPGDAATHDLHAQWLLGPDALVSPVLEQGADSVRAYFPKGTWHSAWDGSGVDAAGGGRTVTLEAPLGTVPVHFRAGSVIPLQRSALTTRAVRASPLRLLVVLGPPQGEGGLSDTNSRTCGREEPTQHARGRLFWDAGDSLAEDDAGVEWELQACAMPHGGELRLSAPAGACSTTQRHVVELEVWGWRPHASLQGVVAVGQGPQHSGAAAASPGQRVALQLNHTQQGARFRTGALGGVSLQCPGRGSLTLSWAGVSPELSVA